MVPRLPRIAGSLVVGAWLAWAGFSLANDCRTALVEWRVRQANLLPNRWRFGNASVARLARCTAGVEGLLPRGSTVLFDSPAAADAARFFRWRWASYLLPDLDVVAPAAVWDPKAANDVAEGRAAYAIAYHAMPAAPPRSHLDLSRQLDGCRLYRIVRP